MKPKGKALLFFVVLTVLALLGSSLADTDIKENQPAAFEDLFEGFVYYANKQKTGLKSIKKKFAATLDSHELGMEILKTLIEGPQLSDLGAIWPKDTKINSLFITDDGKAYIDLNLGQGMMENMDTLSEFLAIYSMVNSLTVNIPSIKMVKILIQGKDALTLAGHIDLEYFYKTNMLIVT